MSNLISGYFSNMFTSHVNAPDYEVLSRVRIIVSDDMNPILLALMLPKKFAKLCLILVVSKFQGPMDYMWFFIRDFGLC